MIKQILLLSRGRANPRDDYGKYCPVLPLQDPMDIHGPAKKNGAGGKSMKSSSRIVKRFSRAIAVAINKKHVRDRSSFGAFSRGSTYLAPAYQIATRESNININTNHPRHGRGRASLLSTWCRALGWCVHTKHLGCVEPDPDLFRRIDHHISCDIDHREQGQSKFEAIRSVAGAMVRPE